MTKILPWGHFLPTDEDGFILNDCHWDKILPPWITLVEELRKTCLGVWDFRLQGLYLRGSVPRGLAILKVSDLDSFAILAGKITSEDINQAQKISEALKRRYLFCKKVELILFDETLTQNNHSIWPVIIQTQSLKIAGPHLPLSLHKTKPGLDLISYSYTWNRDLGKTLDILKQLSPQSCQFSVQVKKQCAWITRRMIRVGLELVMEHDPSYTPDLYHCYERFSTYFPEHRTSMKKALELAIDPSYNRPGLIIFLRKFGGWLAAELDGKFHFSVAGEASTNKRP